jgi:hypothetical protein
MKTIDQVLIELRDKVGNIEISNDTIKERNQLMKEYNALFSAGLIEIQEKSNIEGYEKVDTDELPYYFMSSRYFTYKDQDGNLFLISTKSPLQVTFTIMSIPNCTQKQLDELVRLQQVVGMSNDIVETKGEGGEILNVIGWLIVAASIIILFTEFIFSAIFIGIPAATVFFVLGYHAKQINLLSKYLD